MVIVVPRDVSLGTLRVDKYSDLHGDTGSQRQDGHLPSSLGGITGVWCQKTGQWSDHVTITPPILSQVACWASCAVLKVFLLRTLESEVTIYVNVLTVGWGALLGHHTLQRLWTQRRQDHDINVLELEVVIFTLWVFLPHLTSCVVWVMCSTAVLYISRKGRTKAYKLTQLVIQPLRL